MKTLGIIEMKGVNHFATYDPNLDAYGYSELQCGVFKANLMYCIFYRNELTACAILAMADLTGYPPSHYFKLCRMTLTLREDGVYVAESHG